MYGRNEHGKFVPPNAGQYVDRAELLLHACRSPLQVQIPDAMPIHVVNLLEFIQINVDQTKDAALRTGVQNAGFKSLVEGEAVVDIRKQVELGAMEQVGV